MTANPDPVVLRRAVDAARSTFPGSSPVAVAPDVQASWRRCLSTVPAAGVAPTDLEDPWSWWTESPIRRAAAGAIAELADLARREDYVAAVTDQRGCIIWSSAGRDMLRRAERANFVDGANWSEAVAGTNAPGLSLVTGRPSVVFASEHWCDSVQDWVCYAAPVRDVSGAVVGVIDLSAHWTAASPLALTTVRAVARVVELELAADPGLRRAPLRVRVLGDPSADLHGQPVHLSQRQLEIVTILALLRTGVGADELHAHLYGDRLVSASTLKAEVSHLRSILGGAIESRPYRFAFGVDLDAAIALEALGHGDAETALRCYRGPLLPATESPFLVDTRHRLDVALRDLLLRYGDAGQLLRFSDHHPFDRAVLERTLEVLPSGDHRQAEVLGRLATA